MKEEEHVLLRQMRKAQCAQHVITLVYSLITPT